MTAREQIPAGVYAGLAVVDAPALDALDRLVGGGVRGPADLALAEAALAGIIVHERCACAEENYRPKALTQGAGGLLDDLPTPAFSFAPDDPTVPPLLRADLAAPGTVADAYIGATFSSAVKSGELPPNTAPFIAVSGTLGVRATGQLVSMDGGRQELSLPSFADVLWDGFQASNRARRVVGGFFGGASILTEDFAASHVAKLLCELDRLYDPYPALAAEVTRRPSVTIPPLLGAILDRAETRDKVPAEIVRMKELLSPAVKAFFLKLFKLHGEVDRTRGETILAELTKETTRMHELVNSALPKRQLGIRGLSPEMFMVLSAAQHLVTGNLGAAAQVVGQWFSTRASQFKFLNWSLTPSLADTVFRGTDRPRALPPEELLVKHLSQMEMDSIREGLRLAPVAAPAAPSGSRP